MLRGCWRCAIADKPYIINRDTFDFRKTGSTLDKFIVTFSEGSSFFCKRAYNGVYEESFKGTYTLDKKDCVTQWYDDSPEMGGFHMDFTIYYVKQKQLLMFLKNDSMLYSCRKKGR